MIRPAERFTVNIVRPEPTPAPSLAMVRAGRMGSAGRVSAASFVALAAILGSAVGGFVPLGRSYFAHPPVMAGSMDIPGAVEPAAGPADGGSFAPESGLMIPRAPDGFFYAAVGIDRVPIAMRLELAKADSSLSPSDAARLAAGSRSGHALRVAEVTLAGRRTGPVELAIGSDGQASSVLGAGLLDRLASVVVEGNSLRLSPR